MKTTKIIIHFLNVTGFLSSVCGALVYMVFIQNANASPQALTQLNFEALIIAMAVLVCVVLLAVTVCCCYCCRCCGRLSRSDRIEDEFARKRERDKQVSDDRRAERRARHDEIRKKYGLMSDSDHPYSKFENE